MPYCSKCKEDFEGQLTSCPKCGQDFNGDGKEDKWVLVAKILDKTSAEFARETLQSYDIPVAIISESGFFGDAGLNLPSMSGKGLGKYKVYVPGGLIEEAENILEMTLGNNWEKAEDE